MIHLRPYIMVRFTGDAVMELRTKREALLFFVRQASPQVLLLSGTALLAARIFLGGWRLTDALLALVMPASWHIQERLLHEYLLHLRRRPFRTWWLLKRIAEYHRRHHRDPWQAATLFITTSSYLFNIPALFGLLFAITRDIRLTISGSCAYLFTVLCYEWCHLLIHTSYVPRTNWYRRRWWNHRLHHFKDSRYWFGITSPMWDVVLGSRPDPSTIPTRRKWHGANILE
jgi:hypothetical protein